MQESADQAEPQRLLIIDDASENIAILGELLSEYQRSFALDGVTALRRLAADETPALRAPAAATPLPDLILLDIMMPHMDGFEVCKRLKADGRLREIPVIFITAMGEVEAEAKGFELGAVDYITKPFSPVVVKARVRTHLALKKAREQLAQQNEILEQQVAARTAQLAEALERVKRGSLETILRLSRAAELRDEDTGEHLLRMSEYAACVARKLGLPEKDVENLLYAAPLHDIGKIGIPDRILLKPSELSPDEWALMKQHPVIGDKILAGSVADVIKLGEVVALTHHEKWDGSGYPHGLKGQGIPIAGRIVAIADVFDALTAERPYKQSYSFEKSMAIIRQGRGSHFDPEVVDAFLAIQDEILRIKAAHEQKSSRSAVAR